MWGRILTIAFFIAALAPAIAWAGPRESGAPQISVPDTVVATTGWSITIKAENPEPDDTIGACTGGSGLADVCPTAHTCYCYTSTGTASGSVGHGNVTVYETIDYTQHVGVDLECSAAYFDIEIADTTGQTRDNESIGGSGADCYNDSFPIEYVSGGCALGAASTRFSNAMGQCSGTWGALTTGSNPYYPLKFSITGKAIKN